MSASLDDEASTDGWGEGSGAGWALAFIVVGVVALGLLVWSLSKPTSRGLGREPAALDGGR